MLLTLHHGPLTFSIQELHAVSIDVLDAFPLTRPLESKPDILAVLGLRRKVSGEPLAEVQEWKLPSVYSLKDLAGLREGSRSRGLGIGLKRVPPPALRPRFRGFSRDMAVRHRLSPRNQALDRR